MTMKFSRRDTGLGMIGWIISMPLVLIGLLILVVIFFEGRKAYWDNKVREMCEKDGGVIIQDKLEITLEEYANLPKVNNIVTVPAVSNDAPVFSESKSTYLHRSDPEVRRTEVHVIRRKDKKVIANYAMYSRVGGDFPTIIGHPTYFSCPDTVKIVTELSELFLVDLGAK